jgi:threonine dehydrogenase-like Zn-dependent dehydrogenase
VSNYPSLLYPLLSWSWRKKRLTNIYAAQTVDYLDNGKIKTKGIVNKTFPLEKFGEALESIKDKSAIKAAIVFD